jgi:hypothetical protein
LKYSVVNGLNMRPISAEFAGEERRGPLRLILAAAGPLLLLTGCAAQKKPAIPWATAVLVRPVVPAAASENSGDTPDIQPEIPAPEPLTVVRSIPPRPHVAAPPAAHEAPSGKPEMPQIVPELSAQESSVLQRETQQNLDEAQRNVNFASQRNLNPTQTDLASKVRGFIADAYEAGKAGDWSRARDLAKKAQVLSEELVNSL